MGEDLEARLARELLGAPPKARLYRLQDEAGETSWVAELDDGRQAVGATRLGALRNLRSKLAERAPHSRSGIRPGR